MLAGILNLLLLKAYVLTICQANPDTQRNSVAIVGGSISGTFSARYLADYDTDCSLSIVLFEPTESLASLTTISEEASQTSYQTSRVASIQIPTREDGGTDIVEAGASVFYSTSYLVQEMIHNDADLQLQVVNRTTNMGVYEGNGKWPLLMTNPPDITGGRISQMTWRKLLLVGRYSWELVGVIRQCQIVLNGLARIPLLLQSLEEDSFFDSPLSLWEASGLAQIVSMPWEAFLARHGVGKTVSWLRSLLPYQGSLRNELLTALSLAFYNQDNSQLNALAGLGSLVAAIATSVESFSVVGGNYKLILSAWKQAEKLRTERCQPKAHIERRTMRVTTILGHANGGFTLYSDQEILGKFDNVILACPMQLARINFVIQSHWDHDVIQSMPLAGLVDPHQERDNNQERHEGNDLLPRKLPDSATRPYTRTVTTVVGNGFLNSSFFSIKSMMPDPVLLNVPGKLDTFNITSIERLSDDVYKIQSSDTLTVQALETLFGLQSKVLHVQRWSGGAFPNYQGKGTSLPFVLYDIEAAQQSSALFYPNAMEQSSLASMEISAIGARAVSKLIAMRIGLVRATRRQERSDEL